MRLSSSGSLPETLFSVKSRTFSSFNWLRFEGRTPLMRLKLMLRTLRRESSVTWSGIGPVKRLFWSWRELRKERLPICGLMEPESLSPERSRPTTLRPGLLHMTPVQLHGDDDGLCRAQVEKGFGGSKLILDMKEIKASLSVVMLKEAGSVVGNLRLRRAKNIVANLSTRWEF